MISTTLDPETLTGEALSLTLLSKALFTVPDREWLDGLIAEQVFAEAPFGGEQAETQTGLALLRKWSEANRNGISEDHLSDLTQDYNHLFLGVDPPMPVPPYGSVYLSREKLVFQEETRKVREWYLRFNLLPEKVNQEPDDHIALELLFLSRLAQLSLAAMDTGVQAAADGYTQAQADFLEEQLLKWGFVWCRGMEEHAKTDHYRGLGYLVHGVLLSLAKLLELKPPKEAVL